jgi:hypothetical protein
MLSQPRYVKNLLALPPPAIIDGTVEPSIVETASQTYDAGDLVYIDANGTIAICTRSTNRMDGEVLGQAMRDATGTTGAAAYVRPIRPGDVYMFNLFHTTAASAVGTAATVGTVYGLFYSDALRWHIDLVNTTVEDLTVALAKVKVIGVPDQGFDGAVNAVTDIYAVVYARFVLETIGTDGAPRTRNLQYFS